MRNKLLKYENIGRVFLAYRKMNTMNVSYQITRGFSAKYPRVNVETILEVEEKPPYICGAEEFLIDYFSSCPGQKQVLRKEILLACSDPDFSWCKLGVDCGFYLSHPRMTDQEVYYAFLSKSWPYVCLENKESIYNFLSKLENCLRTDLDQENWKSIDDLLQNIGTKPIGLPGIGRALLLERLSRHGRIRFWGKDKETVFCFQMERRSKSRLIELKHEIGTNSYLLRLKNDFRKFVIGTL